MQTPVAQSKHQTKLHPTSATLQTSFMESGNQNSSTTTVGTIIENMFKIAIISFIVTTVKSIVDTIYNFLSQKSDFVIIPNHSFNNSKVDVKEIAAVDDKHEDDETFNDTLFPSIDTKRDSVPFKEEQSEECLIPTSCSMGLTTRLLPVKNAKGELEWVFTEDDSMLNKGTELDVFKIPQPHDFKFKDHNGNHHNQHHQHNHNNELSPTMSNSSNETTLSTKLEFNSSQSKEQSVSPNGSSHGSSSPYMGGEEEEAEEEEEEYNETRVGHERDYTDGEQSFSCPHCDAVFKIRGYLTRHMKKHSSDKAYSCPFHLQSIYKDDNDIVHKCHPTGGFSRRDTYKTHLKSRHFNYPKGVKPKNKPNSEGHCSMCGEFFNSAEIWCEMHVEGGECKYLPQDYKGKSRLKNRLKKKLQKNEEITDPQLLPFTSKVLEEVKEQRMQKKLARKERKKRTLKKQIQQQHILRHDVANPSYQHHSSVVANGSMPTSSPQHMDTPGSMASSSQYESSSVHSPFTPSTSKSPLSLMTNNYVKEDQSHHSQPQYTTAPYQFEQIETAHTGSVESLQEDYDDDFCLDVDQLSPQSTRQFNEMVEYIKLQQSQQGMQGQGCFQQQQQQQQQQQYNFQTSQQVGGQYVD
ncbi:STP2 [Candida theae]|uniref:STP2 n=1 Tax=Candida theae TaxID=1198502 RepID=A0AAD5BAL0_9ASCO|nr:STP2 [Candida theae]KAI5949145.1 STP2 [Candida theae]